MNILRRIFHKKEKRQEFNGDMKIYYRNLYLDLKDSIEKGKIDLYSAKGWFRHLPARYIPNNFYTEEVNLIIDDCFKILYDYCIKEKIISSYITFEDFYEGKELYNNEYPLSVFYKKHPLPLKLVD